MIALVNTVPDILRWVLVVTSSLFIGGALRMVGRFWHHLGILTFLLGGSLLVASADGYALARIGEPLKWYTPVALVGVLVLIFSLTMLARFGPNERVTWRAVLHPRPPEESP